MDDADAVVDALDKLVARIPQDVQIDVLHAINQISGFAVAYTSSALDDIMDAHTASRH